MFDDLSLSFFERQMWEGQNCPQHFAHISGRESWQSFDFELLSQRRIALAVFRPFELGRRNEPKGTSGQGGMVFPGGYFCAWNSSAPNSSLLS